MFPYSVGENPYRREKILSENFAGKRKKSRIFALKIVKNTMKQIFFTLLIMLFAAGAGAQTENPRGIYKMVSLEGRTPLINAPFDQYKILTDDVTLTLFVQPTGIFELNDNDRQVLNYTGSEPKTPDDHSMLVYDSDAKGFKFKWWSTMRDNMYFPDGGWVTEYYESGKFSDNGRIIFDALLQKFQSDPARPLVGTWRQLGWMDELRDTKKALAALEKNYATSPSYGSMMTILPAGVVFCTINNGDEGFRVHGRANKDYAIVDRNTMKLGGDVLYKIIWLNKNTFAMEVKPNEWRTDYTIYQRIESTASLMSVIK